MGCGCDEPKKVKYVCSACGKEEEREEAKEGETVKSCCGKVMNKKKE